MGKYAGCTSPSSSAWIKFALLGIVISVLSQGISCETEPTESQCRPYIEKALKEQHLEEEDKAKEEAGPDVLSGQEDSPPTDELTDSTEDSILTNDQDNEENETEKKDDDDDEGDEGDLKTEEEGDFDENDKNEETEKEDQDLNVDDDITKEDETDSAADIEKREVENDSEKDTKKETEQNDVEMNEENSEDEENEDENDDILETPINIEVQEVQIDDDDDDIEDDKEEKEEEKAHESLEIENETNIDGDVEKKQDNEDDENDDKDNTETDKEDDKDDTEDDEDNKDNAEDEKEQSEEEQEKEQEEKEQSEKKREENEEDKADEESKEQQSDLENKIDDEKEEKEDEKENASEEKVESIEKTIHKEETEISEADSEEDKDLKKGDGQENIPEEELIKEVIIPENLRPRDHINKVLKLDDDSGLETVLEKTIDNTLKTLKNLYDNGIKPLEMLYKYRDLSNRHFGDPEIFSKPLILFMGPWSGGKSSTINYLLDNEYSHTSLRTGAEPSPAYFNILMYGEKEEILDGTQLAADWTFSGLQKFGQGLLDRLKGIKLPSKLLEKVNVVEIPGILEIRKQVQRLFPFNDACQWFIDRADIIFLVYDPSKLDVGPETEAILDQLKGREYQTRIILNKADQVKPEELMRVQGTLIWNISPLMSSSEPPIMYSTSLWSLPYEAGAPTRLLQAQERAFLRDLRDAIDKRVENKISSARRFAVRVRNHAKMVDCYLTTYYNHKTFFGNRKKISDDIIENPQKYHIYEGLSTLTNISRYDLPDPDVYKDFFKINPLYDFQRLSETCTYFRGCPINKLDVVIAYDLPELIGKYRKEVEAAKEKLEKENT